MDKKEAKNRYNEHVNFVTADCKATKVYFKYMIGYLINEKWYEKKLEDKNYEAQRVIITPVKLVMEDIRSIRNITPSIIHAKKICQKWMKHLNDFLRTSGCFCKTWLLVVVATRIFDYSWFLV